MFLAIIFTNGRINEGVKKPEIHLENNKLIFHLKEYNVAG